MKTARGFTLLEVLITVVILAIGLLGLTNLQTKLHMSEVESYQRAQAVILMQDLASRIQANDDDADDYITDADGDGVDAGDWLGFGNTTESCAPPGAGRVEADRCAWQTQLRGASEVDADGNQIGGMIGARGCVQRIQNADTGICRPAVYRVTVAWQGLYETGDPDLTCATGQYGDDALRRAIATVVTVPLLNCRP